MTKALKISALADFLLEISFSNGNVVHFDGAQYLESRTGTMLEPLRNHDFFKRCFIDAGAICWPNGLELSAERIYGLSRVLAH